MPKKVFKSSLITLAEYEPSSEQLTLELADGTRYRYYQVPPNIWKSLIRASSTGKYAATNIMRGHFVSRKLRNANSA